MRWVEKCLQSIVKSTVDLIPVIIDNNSTDGTTEYIKKNYPRFKLIEQKENLGFGRANNIGLEIAIVEKADYVFLLNQDTWIESTTVEKLIDSFTYIPGVGIMSPIHLNGKGNELDHLFSTCIPYKTLEESTHLLIDEKGIIKTDFVNAAAWLVSNDCLLNVGGFDPLFIHYGEDRDYCNRVTYHGYKIGVNFNTSICHDRFYNITNKYRSEQKLLYAVGLVHIKNINKHLVINYLSWIVKRVKKMIKWLITLNFSSLMVEIIIIGKLFFLMKKIINSRKTNQISNSNI